MTATAESIEYNSEQRNLQSCLPGSNVNEVSFLATDYLNHLNEPIMMLEMVPDMPDMLEEVESWQPKSYQQHFRDSLFAAKDIAIEAYEIAPAPFRQPFDMCITMAGNAIMDSAQATRAAIKSGDEARIAFLVERTSSHVRHLIDIASGAINGKPNALDRQKAMELRNSWKDVLANKSMAPVDMVEPEMEEQDDSPSMNQDSIDALFD